MNTRRRFALGTLIVVLLVAASSQIARGHANLGSSWNSGTVTMNMQLSGGSGLSDGSSSYNAAATAALAIWNASLNRIQFAAATGSTARADGDQVNQVFFDSNYYGDSFGTNVLAITTRWTIGGTRRVEADVVFNTAFQWDSYRGNLRSAWDIRRVALHEFGHALGLDHPDERGQSVTALMNSILGNLDSLQADDIAGAQSLYGGGVASNLVYPPRNEPADFYSQMNVFYRDVLGAAVISTYVDGEGRVIWVTEYARQRTGQCSHAVASQNTIAQITGTGGTLVCAITPAGTIVFPRRDETVLFMDDLETTYRDVLRATLGSSFVNNEGAVVWILEYLRYRLNGCSHGDAITKVFQQIRGQGVQPVCSA